MSDWTSLSTDEKRRWAAQRLGCDVGDPRAWPEDIIERMVRLQDAGDHVGVAREVRNLMVRKP
jgi:hypothetical protein